MGGGFQVPDGTTTVRLKGQIQNGKRHYYEISHGSTPNKIFQSRLTKYEQNRGVIPNIHPSCKWYIAMRFISLFKPIQDFMRLLALLLKPAVAGVQDVAFVLHGVHTVASVTADAVRSCC